MIVVASFQRNIVFYSNMDLGQLKHSYSQIVSFSLARMLMIDALMSVYNRRALHKGSDNLDIPWDLSRAITLALGNSVPEQYIHRCISGCRWKGYSHMALAAFASAETLCGSTLKYMAAVKESVLNREFIRTVLSLAITGWMVKLLDSKCTCGTWIQAVELLSCFVPDTETTLTIQDEAHLSAYILTLLDLRIPKSVESSRDAQRPQVNYEYIFSELLVAGLDLSPEDSTTHH